MKKLDLKVGTTHFLEPYWKTLCSDQVAGMASMIRSCDEDLPARKNQLKELEEVIKALHKLVGNAETNGYHVVISNGATQAAFAAMYALDKYRYYIKAPYWFRYPIMMEMAGLHKGHKDCKYDQVEIITLPNNPENLLYQPSISEEKVYDLVYNWPQYTKVKKYKKDIMLFGLAKATGHASTRIGWALVKDAATAQKMRYFIEMTTGGISGDSQERAFCILLSQIHALRDKHLPVFEYGNKELKRRWKILKAIKIKNFKILNSFGMFAWCEYDFGIKEFENKYKIYGAPGILSGGTDKNIRINVGCSSEMFDLLVTRLNGGKK